jgi:hypothetical protein
MIITLKSGLKIILDELRQFQTYAGMLEGQPSAKVNDRQISSALGKAKAMSPLDISPYLIQPVRRDYGRRRGDAVLFPHSSYTPEWIPFITCIASFHSFTTKDPEMHASEGIIIWYQDNFALPIGKKVMREITALDWHSFATDFEW